MDGKILFKSNPPLPDSPVVVPLEVDGVITNKVVLQSRSNKSYWAGVSYKAELMSLRAKLNAGHMLQTVSFGQMENDPNVLARKAGSYVSMVKDAFASDPEDSEVIDDKISQGNA